MLARKFRLPVAAFPGRRAQTASAPSFSVRVKRNTLSHNRFGIIISSRALRKSTERHHLKRRLFGVLGSLPDASRDFLVIVSSEIKNLTPAAAEAGLKSAVEKLIQESWR